MSGNRCCKSLQQTSCYERSNLKYDGGASVIDGISGYGGTIPTGQNHVVFKTFYFCSIKKRTTHRIKW